MEKDIYFFLYNLTIISPDPGLYFFVIHSRLNFY